MFAVILIKLIPSIFAAGVPGATCTLPKPYFFVLPPWWEYLNGAYDQLGKCSPSITSSDLSHVILPIGLAALDILLRAAGLIAIISIIIAGVSYITSGGNAETVAKARGRIYNSLIGLAIVFVAAGVVAFIGNSLGGK
jgi:ABC-type antimicrobial peptide transport system permease subunit